RFSHSARREGSGGLSGSGPLAQLLERVVEDLLGLLLRPALLHVREVRLVRLGALQVRRVVLVAPGRQARRGAVDDLGDLLHGEVGREVAHGLVAERIPVRDRDAIRVIPAILLPHGAGSDAGSADGAAARCHSSLLVWWWRRRLAAD